MKNINTVRLIQQLRPGTVNLPHHWRTSRILAAATLAIASFVIMSVPASASVTARATHPIFYLDIGASESVGVQPTILYPHGQLTNQGYANDLVSLEAAKGVPLRLTELGCSGESTATALFGGDHCYHQHNTQIGDAVAFLASHYGDRGIVTIDLGFNDLRPCIHQAFTDAACVSSELYKVGRQLTTIVSELQSAAGPRVHFVGLNHNDPFLAAATNQMHNPALVNSSDQAIRSLNETLSAVYGQFDIPVAKVTNAFATNNDQLVHVHHFGRLPRDVAAACQLTWMCEGAPYGPNIHPNAMGYLAMAKAIDAVLPPLQ